MRIPNWDVVDTVKEEAIARKLPSLIACLNSYISNKMPPACIRRGECTARGLGNLVDPVRKDKEAQPIAPISSRGLACKIGREEKEAG
jgi:hypothetical protein